MSDQIIGGCGGLRAPALLCGWYESVPTIEGWVMGVYVVIALIGAAWILFGSR